MTREPLFPPLLSGEAVSHAIDPFEKAISLATLGCDAGTIVYNIGTDHLKAAFIFAPEVCLEQAVAMMIACGVGFSNALGALAPPEVAVHLEWHGQILVNGAKCGALKIAASVDEPDAMPDWLVVGLEVPLFPQNQDGGLTPDQTTLFEEGCAEVNPVELLEGWSRHTLVWINRWSDEGPAPLHAEWRSKAHLLGEEVTTTLDGASVTGTFLGVDEAFGMLIRTGKTTHIKPLSSLVNMKETP